MRVLIVEDDPMMQLGLEQVLSNQPNISLIGIEEDGYLAVETALKEKPDLILMDIGLPRMDGIEATKKIKQALPEIRIVMLTSHTAETEVIAALSSGADAYCIKGASIDRLYAAIEAASDGATYLDPQVARSVVNHLQQPTPQNDRKNTNLSPREFEVLQLMVEGKTNVEIAEELYLSPNTIKTHVRGIMNKLSVDDRVQAAVTALRSGLVS
ncbi:response regulator transcription factor [Limnoraphis robusta Tam1]|uniref:Response regulator transcription factor n=1 Tax=Limnoraphis robusta CCNP1315 TaxID=3110306 RepID=A0ABU5U5J5_9CYAN|nr:response regulator transcription factor [Limnoraphis robusta]MEA5498565.1 response regulator transcription factor [Limnoraphis robusta BA-68 BA1]MEA5522325.1 response regulator transcription factor [Limnoraphis robusta CCNP1315]MEA5543008.1 response regulator transcription factor [Limnoraphis robusta Tam1]MEA5549106.1 response regulator transcription factor [Limnoraphis robusta CCNP1324]